MRQKTTLMLACIAILLCSALTLTAQKKGFLSGLEKTPFIGHVDLDLNEIKPGLSMQNMQASWATYSAYFSNTGSFFGIGILNSSGPFKPNSGFMAIASDLLFIDDLTSTVLMRLRYDQRALAVGIDSVATGSKLHVVQAANAFGDGVTVGEYGGPAQSSIAGVFGKNIVADSFGVGVSGLGGKEGVRGTVTSTSSSVFYGVRGTAFGTPGTKRAVSGEASGSGTKIGIYGEAIGSGTNRGVYGTASGGTNNFAGFFDGQLSTTRVRNNITTFNNGFDIAATGSGTFAGITVRYSDQSNVGSGLFFHASSSGINIGAADGGVFRPLNASAFNVTSDRGLKKEITHITPILAAGIMEQLRNIESAYFWYKDEDKTTRTVPHLGVIAQSLPKELITTMSGTPAGLDDQTFLGVGLADWLGIVTVGVKENDRRLQEMEKENKRLMEENEAIRARLDALEAMFQELRN